MTDAGDWIVAFLSIWVFPKTTIRKIVAADPRRFITEIGWITGAMGALVFEVEASNSAALTAIPRWAVGMGPVTLAMSAFTLGLAGVGFIHLLALFFHWAGRLLGGRGSLTEVRAAVAWSWLPLILLGVVAVIAAILSPSPNLWEKASDHHWYHLSCSRMAEAELAVWTLFLMAEGLREVHKISNRRAWGLLGLGGMAITFCALGVFIVTSTVSRLI